MLKRVLTAAALMACLAPASIADTEDESSITTLGWLEHVRVTEVDLKLDAKLDTGAKTSSIHAEIIDAPARKDFVSDEEQTIVFRLVNEKGHEREMRAPIARWAAIKTKKGGVLYRPVVDMTFCLGGVSVSGEVTLANRGHFNYETLIGRNMLKKAKIIVDPGRIYTNKARCDV